MRINEGHSTHNRVDCSELSTATGSACVWQRLEGSQGSGEAF